ncbi:hypothetical protein EV356DRAFT_518524 [Viridothelium virens]|uniref:Uncharacterized protein n=1 Tax=Viridothelium virens TaxID=1048519 RepID=A0A6A6H1D1_VIRVR|nr:hypothetical protein EV356DRAFT_518524 [Viridothelium virens]
MYRAIVTAHPTDSRYVQFTCSLPNILPIADPSLPLLLELARESFFPPPYCCATPLSTPATASSSGRSALLVTAVCLKGQWSDLNDKERNTCFLQLHWILRQKPALPGYGRAQKGITLPDLALLLALRQKASTRRMPKPNHGGLCRCHRKTGDARDEQMLLVPDTYW